MWAVHWSFLILRFVSHVPRPGERLLRLAHICFFLLASKSKVSGRLASKQRRHVSVVMAKARREIPCAFCQYSLIDSSAAGDYRLSFVDIKLALHSPADWAPRTRFGQKQFIAFTLAANPSRRKRAFNLAATWIPLDFKCFVANWPLMFSLRRSERNVWDRNASNSFCIIVFSKILIHSSLCRCGQQTVALLCVAFN